MWKSVPVTFVVDLNPSNLVHEKYYKVFDSVLPDDTPEKALQRLNIIPIVKDNQKSEEAAYYKATVGIVKGMRIFYLFPDMTYDQTSLYFFTFRNFTLLE